MWRMLNDSRVYFFVVALLSASGAASAASCQSSSLTGFTSSIDLSGNGLVLHWALDGTQATLRMALEAKSGSGAESGWISAGWSADGRMYPADCVVGNLPGGEIGAYYMSGYGDADVVPTSSFSLGSAAMLTSNGGTIMQFSRSSGDGGAIAVNVAGANTIIWAYSESGSTALGFHGRNDGATSVDFSCVGAAAAANSTAGSGAGGNTGSNTTTGGSSAGSNTTTGDGEWEGGRGEGGEGAGLGSGSSSGAAACQSSSLSGYEHSVTVTSGLLLHWTLVSAATTTTSTSTGGRAQVQLALEAQQGSGAESGWISIGWSTDGRMAPADAVIGNLPGNAVAAYAMTGYQMSDVAVTTNFSVAEASTETASNGATVVKFTRTEGDGGIVPVDFTGVNTLVWAFSGSGTQALDYHNHNDGVLKVDFTCSTATADNSTAAAGNTTASAENSDSQSLGATSAATSDSSSSSSSSACTASSLSGYDCMMQLSGDSFILHWKVSSTATTISLAAEAATSGWVSVGWSATGRMYPADAAIGNLPSGTLSNGAAVGAYYMSGYGVSDVTQTGSFAVSNAVVEATGNGRTTIKFERSMTDGEFPMGGTSTVLWAYSRDNSQQLADHGPNAGSATINFVTGASEVGESSSGGATLYSIHAWMLTVAFGVLMPAAILISRLFLADKPMPSPPPAATGNATAGTAATAAAGGVAQPMLGAKEQAAAGGEAGEDAPALVSLTLGGPAATANPEAAGVGGAAAAAGGAAAVPRKPWLSKPVAFEAHKWLMLSAVLLALAGIIMAFVEKGAQSLHSTHGQLGLAVMVLIVAQPIVGQLRPLKKHPSRPSWFALHWVIGVGTVAIAWANTYLGFDLATSKFGYDLDWSYIAFSVMIGLFSVVYVFDFMLDQVGFCCLRFEETMPEIPAKTMEIV
ncbi:hypothetical protein CLOM_g19924 [Closterium sp. NIES-68]|nr:hypothetical protein CLOM_g19924 [Closterium sp. NIES-68]